MVSAPRLESVSDESVDSMGDTDKLSVLARERSVTRQSLYASYGDFVSRPTKGHVLQIAYHDPHFWTYAHSYVI